MPGHRHPAARCRLARTRLARAADVAVGLGWSLTPGTRGQHQRAVRATAAADVNPDRARRRSVIDGHGRRDTGTAACGGGISLQRARAAPLPTLRSPLGDPEQALAFHRDAVWTGPASSLGEGDMGDRRSACSCVSIGVHGGGGDGRASRVVPGRRRSSSSSGGGLVGFAAAPLDRALGAAGWRLEPVDSTRHFRPRSARSRLGRSSARRRDGRKRILSEASSLGSSLMWLIALAAACVLRP